jgi:exonuclease VII large subunit
MRASTGGRARRGFGPSRAASGHCYFTLKDAGGQMRCAMFRRAASLLDFAPRDGDLVELRARLSVYERVAICNWWSSRCSAPARAAVRAVLLLKAKLEAEGLFDPAASAPCRAPRGIGLVTSLGAAALHDVLTALRGACRTSRGAGARAGAGRGAAGCAMRYQNCIWRRIGRLDADWDQPGRRSN